MKHLYRDGVRSLLTVLLIACAAAIAGLGAAVYLFTAQQTQAVEDSSITLAVRHLTDAAQSGIYIRDSKLLAEINGHSSVKVPALTKAYITADASVTPVYSGDAAGSCYNWSRDDELARTVMTVTCMEDLGQDPYADCWYALVRVDEVHLPLPYDMPEEIKIVGYTRGAANAQKPLVPGETYLLCGRYEDYFQQVDYTASFANGQYTPVYRQDRSQPPKLYLTGWNDTARWMQYIASADDVQWREEAVRIGSIANRCLRLDCINDLNRLRWFMDGTAAIVEGRSFTEAEQENGAKVCLVSQELARANGLSIGDSISMTAYAPTISVEKWYAQDKLDQLYDMPDVYSAQYERVTLQIVGIYSAPLYTNTIDEFVPNTVIAPYNAVQLDPGRGYKLPIQTQNLILHNGQGEAFLQAVRDAGYPDGLYTIEETNYAAVEEILSLMRADSRMLLLACAGVGGLLYLLILYLYARSWRRENAILSMLGTTRTRIALRMFAALAVLVLLGCGAALAGVIAAKSLIESALNSVYIASSMDFSAVRVGAFSETGMTLAPGTIAAAVGLTAGAFLLMAAFLSIHAARKKANTCLFD